VCACACVRAYGSGGSVGGAGRQFTVLFVCLYVCLFELIVCSPEVS
jgi:hypothetical protein